MSLMLQGTESFLIFAFCTSVFWLFQGFIYSFIPRLIELLNLLEIKSNLKSLLFNLIKFSMSSHNVALRKRKDPLLKSKSIRARAILPVTVSTLIISQQIIYSADYLLKIKLLSKRVSES